MTYLVDASVLSEPTKLAPSSKVIDWLSANERNLVVDSIILGELCIGILALAPGRKGVRNLFDRGKLARLLLVPLVHCGAKWCILLPCR
jgi:predicted nucleic acid-binding protein